MRALPRYNLLTLSTLLAAALLWGSLVTVAPAGAAGDPPQLRRDGRWMVDPDGRVVLLHGMNAVWKLAPYYPPDSLEGFTAADADWLVDHGFNTVRIGTLFVGVMPEPDVIDTDYLDAWDRVVDLLADRGIWVMFDFHQDLYNEEFQGEGFPDWAVYDTLTDSLPDPTFGFPGNYLSPHVSEVFDNFWADTDGVIDRWSAAWAAVAAYWVDQPYSMGYDLMNEPWSGNEWHTCANPAGCPVSDATELQPAFDRALAAIRVEDPGNIVWYEPYILFDFGTKSSLTAVDGEENLGFSWHNYCISAAFLHSSGATDLPGCGQLEDLVFSNAEDTSTAMNATSLLSEFGASDDLPDIESVTSIADDYLVGWQYWHYKEWADPTTESGESGGQGMFTDDADLGTLKQDKAEILVRTYPQATAGIPTSLEFDTATGDFTYVYTPRSASDRTTIFVSPLHYPDGYVVEVDGGVVITDEAPLVTIAESAGATQTTVRIRDGAGPDAEPVPDGDVTDGEKVGGDGLAATGGGRAVAVAGLLALAAAGVLRRRSI